LRVNDLRVESEQCNSSRVRPCAKRDILIGGDFNAEVHEHSLGEAFDDYREHVSDHVPVSVRVRVVPDSD
jgi:endonuclease/exonuclease/phosphatase family metal-dependent hydrolase